MLTSIKLLQVGRDIGDFLGGGVTEGGGFPTAVRATMFVCNGAVTPGPSRECDITIFVKGRPESVQQLRDSTVAARKAQSVTVPLSRVSRECRSPDLRSPPLENARQKYLISKAYFKKTEVNVLKTLQIGDLL